MDIVSSGLNIDDGRLYSYAQSAAKLLKTEGEGRPRAERSRLRRESAALRRAHGALVRAVADREPNAAEAWLLDNYYLIARETRRCASELKDCATQRLCEGESLGFALSRSLLRAGGGAWSEERLVRYLDGFQSVCVLRQSEWEALGVLSRCAILSALAEVCRAMERGGDVARCAALFSNLFAALRRSAVMDYDAVADRVNVPGLILAGDATGEYPRMDAPTRRAYLRRLEELAARRGVEAQTLARTLVERSQREGRHLGFYLFGRLAEGRAEIFLSVRAALSAALALLLLWRMGPLTLGLLGLPLLETVSRFSELVLSRLVRPRRLPRLDLSRGIPPEGKTVCVLCVLLTDESAASRAARRLEELYYSCGGDREKGVLSFALLADLPEADEQTCQSDEPILNAAREAVGALNRRLGGGFCLLTRPRRFDGERYTPNERKRGALCALAALLLGRESELVCHGDTAAMSGAHYILTLDADTVLYPDSARELIGAALHPLNRPQIDEARGVVTAGHGIFQLHVGATLSSATATDFSLIFAPPGGSDPYASLCGELYMDAFDAGGFTGKGLLDAHALYVCTAERLDGRGILSHDAPEGAYLRGAVLGDESCFDTFPASPNAYYRRLHRWVRGDWQNLRFLFDGALRHIERYRFLDKLRHSLVAPAALAALLTGFLRPDKAGAAAMAVCFCLLGELLPALLGELRRHGERSRRKSRVLAPLGGAILRCFVRLWLLPWEAWICASAALTALWRMAVSHRRLLQWETAAQSEARGESPAAYARAMAAALPIGLGAMCLSRTVIGHAAGLMWLLSPLAAWALSLPSARPAQLSSTDRAYLRGAAGETWRFFSALRDEADHGLPPDNFQTQPRRGAAHSISPTNLGLAMTAAVAAVDLEAIEPTEALDYIRSLTDTAMRLRRYRGHFYNWYSTRTLEVLQPPMISTVDSGNLCAAMLTAAAFAKEQGDEELAGRLDGLAGEMDFSFLYDPARSLFAICYDPLRQRRTGGWYDLMASEATLTSYLAVARGQAPRRHWRALGRTLLGRDGYRGLASWNGSMFEYLMSALFLPLQRGSLLDESCRFCLHAQRRRALPGQPWGVSESAFFSLDAAGRYRYKAHGVGALALKRGQDAEYVVSPYSSFLALCVDPQAAVRNLRRLEKLGMRGPYGFYEALDLTPSRCRGDRGERVCTMMAHHAAMSLCAAANALCEGSISRRFMSRAQLAAFLPLLSESLDETRRPMRRGEEKPGRRPCAAAARGPVRGEKGEKGCTLLSNGAYTVALTERGEQAAWLNETAVSDARFGGVSLRLRAGAGEVVLMPSLCRRWELGEDYARYEYATPWGTAGLCISVGGAENGTLYELELPAGAGACTVTLQLVPLLSPRGEYADHPAYARLGIRAEEKDGALLLRRIARRGRDLYMAIRSTAPMSFTADADGSKGPVLLRPALRLRVTPEPDAATLRFALCLARDEAEALAGSRRLLGATALLRAGFTRGAATLLGLSGEGLRFAMELYRACYGHTGRDGCAQSELWALGLSGDRPLLVCRAGSREETDFVRGFCLLRALGVDCEAALVTDETGEYAAPDRERVVRELSRVGLEALLGTPGGLFLCPGSAERALVSRAAFAAGDRSAPREMLPAPEAPPRSLAEGPEGGFDGEGVFSVTLPGRLPKKPWQQLLFAADCGWLVSECGSGWLWQGNAREGRVNPPPREPEDSRGSECLWAETPGGRVSLFAAEDGIPCRVSYGAAFARWEKEIDGRSVSLTGFLDPESGARVLLLSGAAGLTILWRMELELGAPGGAAVRARVDEGVFCAENPDSFLPEMRFSAAVSAKARWRCDYANSGFLAAFTASEHEVLVCRCGRPETVRALCGQKAALGAYAAAVRAASERYGRFRLRSSDAALDRYMNHWCLHQIYARLEARTSLYQSGGAYGFRDQLQDAVNLLLVDESAARERILDCCRHQYTEGDVMHWWHPHPAGDRGVRTRVSDDLLWLCWALGEYVSATGDRAILRASAPWLRSEPLRQGERDRYETAEETEEESCVLDHALAALHCVVGRGFGPHGLPLMLDGDWNDALSDCGGESVWLAFFLCACARAMAALLSGEEHKRESESCRALAARMLEEAEKSFNGRWYERAYSAHGDFSRGGERIDALVQSWAVFCGAAHAREALEYALLRLVDAKDRTVALLSPPFGADEERFGAITAYGEGVRENGGQYTHAAVWLARACFLAGRPEAGREILDMLLPAGRGARYGAEPYVLCADVCRAPGHEGEALWSWYTGSAGWYFRTVTENLLGLRKEKGAVYCRPGSCALFSVTELTVNGERPEEKGKKGLPNLPEG